MPHPLASFKKSSFGVLSPKLCSRVRGPSGCYRSEFEQLELADQYRIARDPGSRGTRFSICQMRGQRYSAHSADLHSLDAVPDTGHGVTATEVQPFIIELLQDLATAKSDRAGDAGQVIACGDLPVAEAQVLVLQLSSASRHALA